MTQALRPSPLQRWVLIVLAALDAKRPGPVATRDIERVLEQGGDAPLYGPKLQLGDGRYSLREAAYVIRLDGTTCLQLTDAGGIRRIKEGDPLLVASWYQTCFDAGLPVIVQVNESRD